MKIKLIVVGLLFSCASHAEWIQYGTTDSFYSFVNPETIRKTSNGVRAWKMENYFSVQPDGSKSVKTMIEVDCKDNWRILSIAKFSLHNGQGENIKNVDGPSSWMATVPDSIGWSLQTILCGKSA